MDTIICIGYELIKDHTDSDVKLQGQSKVVYLEPGPRFLESEVDTTGILSERYDDSYWKSLQLVPNR